MGYGLNIKSELKMPAVGIPNATLHSSLYTEQWSVAVSHDQGPRERIITYQSLPSARLQISKAHVPEFLQDMILPPTMMRLRIDDDEVWGSHPGLGISTVLISTTLVLVFSISISTAPVLD